MARAASDGNTLLVANTSILINPHLRKQEYDPLTSFAAVCQLVSVPIVLCGEQRITLSDPCRFDRGSPRETR